MRRLNRFAVVKPGFFWEAYVSVRDGVPSMPTNRHSAFDAHERLLLHLDPDVYTRLRHTAEARDQSLEALAGDLLQRGLEQEALRARSEILLDRLTPREQEVVRLTLRGHTNRQIADRLVISPETVKTHVRHALEKFGVQSKTELRLRWLKAGIHNS
jgi:DNA-binding NarL/FixJ family response regulator